MTKIDLEEAVGRLFAFRPDESYSLEEVRQQFRLWCSEAYRCSRGEICLSAGTAAEDFVIVVSGVMHVRMPSGIGDDVLIRTVRPGEYIGVSQVFEPEEILSYDIVSASESEIITVKVECVRQRLSDPEFRPVFDYLARHLCREARAARTRAMILSGSDIADRLRRYLAAQMQQEKSRTITLPGTIGDLARYLAVNRCALSRVLNKLIAERVIAYDNHAITVLDGFQNYREARRRGTGPTPSCAAASWE